MEGDIFTYTSQAFVMEDTKIAEDLVRGAFSLRGHPEIANNPLLANNRGLFRQIEDDLRRSVTPTPNSPSQKTARSTRILVQLTDAEYVSTYRAARKSASRRFRLMSLHCAGFLPRKHGKSRGWSKFGGLWRLRIFRKYIREKVQKLFKKRT